MVDAIATVLRPEFATGLGFGAAALFIAVILGLAWRRRRSGAIPVAGFLLAIAALIALPNATRVPLALWWGIGLLAGGGALVRWVPIARWVATLLVAPGAWLVSTQSVVAGAGWARWFVFLGIMVAVPLLASFAVGSTTSLWTPMMFALFALGIFLSVPDTEEALVLLGVAIPIALLSLPGSPVLFGSIGVHASVGVAMWVIAEGGAGRPASIIGASACLGMLAVEPAARWFTERGESFLDRLSLNLGGLAVVAVTQLIFVVLIARLAGVLTDAALAGAIAGALLATTMLGMILGAPSGRHHG